MLYIQVLIVITLCTKLYFEFSFWKNFRDRFTTYCIKFPNKSKHFAHSLYPFYFIKFISFFINRLQNYFPICFCLSMFEIYDFKNNLLY